MKRITVLLLSLVLTALTLCCAQAELLLPDALVRIEEEAFAGDASFSGVIHLPSRVQSVGDSAFADTRVFGLWLPSATDVVGDSILCGTDATYVVVGSASASLGDHAFADVAVLVGKSGSSAQHYAESAGMPFYPSDSLVWNGGFAYYLDSSTGCAQLAFPAQQRYDSVVIPESVNGWPVAAVSPYAFTNTFISGGISLPQAAYDALPDTQASWPSVSISAYATGVDPVMPPQTQTGYVMQLDINVAHLVMLPGEVCMPYLVGLPDDEYAFSWYVTDESLLTVDENGLMTAIAPGNVALTMVAVPTRDGEATAGELGITAYYGVMQIQVCEPSVSIDLTETTISMKTGATLYMHIPVQCPSSVNLPEMSFETDNEAVVSLRPAYGTDVQLTAMSAGQATVTVTATVPAAGGYDAVSASASFTVVVTEPDVLLSHASLYTYCGYTHELYVAEELPDSAAVSWSASNDLVTLSDSGRVVIGDAEGESVITCTVTYADGTSKSADIPVYIKPWLSFGEAHDRDDLNPGWAYGYFWDDLMPELYEDLWPHDLGTIVVSAESSDEEVLSFELVQDANGNRLIAVLAGWPGEATLSYSATLNLADGSAIAPAPAVSDPFLVTVNPPQVTARLDSDCYYLSAEDRVAYFSYWWDGPYSIQYATFHSSDESVFTVSPTGQIIAVGDGWAQLSYTIHCYGVTSTAVAWVEVSGFITEMNPAEITLAVGETAAVVPVLPVSADSRECSFFSDDSDIASVNGSGLVSGLHAGTTKIYYRTLSGDSVILSQCTVHVVDDAARLSLNVTGIDLYEGETLQLEAICSETPVSLVWTSSNDSAVTVDENGLVRVISSGWSYPSCDAVTCTATFGDGSTEQASCVVYATVPVLSFTYYHPYYSMSVGETQELHHGVSFTEGYSPEDFEIEYVSDDERVAVIDPVSGIITAVGQGVTQVSVAYRLDGRIMGATTTYVYVDTELPGLDDVSIGLNPEHLFICAPQDGETSWAMLDAWISDNVLQSYYAPYYTAQENDIFRVYDDGNVAIFGEGSAEVYVQLHSTMTDTLYDEPLGVGRLTVGTPAFAFTVLDCNGHESSYAEEDGVKTVRPGDIVTVSVTGVPEDIGSEFTYWDYDYDIFQEIRRTDRTLTLRAMLPGESSIHMGTNLSCNTSFDLNETLRVSGTVGEFQLSEPAITLAVGETHAIWPGFNWSEGVFSSSDESVVVPVEGEFPYVYAVAPGYAVLTARCEYNGQTIEASCFVTVLESEWSLRTFYAERVMSIGYQYDPMVDIEFTGTVCPEITFSFCDDSIMRLDEERRLLVPLRAGTVTVTVTATKDGRSESVSREITVFDSGVYLAGGNTLSLCPGQSELLTLVCSRDVASVVWSSTHPHAVTVSADDASPLNAVVTAQSGYAVSAIVTAAITYADGSTGSISALVSIMQDNEVWIDLYADDREIRMGEEASIDYSLWCNVPIVGLTFTSSNESVVAVSARGRLLPVAPGTASVTITAGTYGASVSREIQVTVHGYAASLSPSSLTLEAGEARFIVPTVDLGGTDDQIDCNSISFCSTNESVARVDELGMVTGICAGGSTIVYSAYTLSGEHILLYCPVTVRAGETSALTLNASSITLYPHQSFTFIPSCQAELTGDIIWSVDDSDIYVGYDEFTLTADQLDVSGERRFSCVTCTAEIDGREETAVCQVEYLPATVSIVDFPSYCQLSAGEKTKLAFTVNRIDPGAAVYPSFSSDDPSIASVDANGFITGLSEGICTIRIDLNDAEGRSLYFDTVSVYVDTALPTPLDEDACFAFEYPLYYLNMDDSLPRTVWLNFEDPYELTSYYPLHIVSEDEHVVRIDGNNVTAVGKGTTTLRAWLEGFEECAVTAGITVDNPSFSFNGPTDEYGRPVVRAGETLTVRLTGFPPFGQDDPDTQIEPNFIRAAYDSGMLGKISQSDEEITFLALRGGETCLNIDIDLGIDWWHNFNIDIVIEETGAGYRLNHTAVVLAQGEILDLWPGFDWISVEQVVSSDEAVVRPLTHEEWEDVPAAVEAVAPGQADVTLTVLLPDEETRVSVPCTVHVVENTFTLTDMDSISSVMIVGERYGEIRGDSVSIDFSGCFRPQLTYESSDPDVLAVGQTEDGWAFIPVSPGTAVLSVTAERNGVVQYLEKTISVVEPKVHFESRYADVRPGQTMLLPLVIVNHTDEKTVENVTYTSENPGLVIAEDAFCGYPAMRITGVGESGDTRIVVTVDFMDGTSASAVCSVHITSNDEVWVNAWIQAPTLYTQTWGEGGTEDVVWMMWRHNAAHWDEENPGTDTAMIEWFVDGEPIETMHSDVVEFVRLIGEDAEGEVPWNNGPIFRALSAGEVTLSAHLTLYDASGAFLAEADAQTPLTVIEPECVIEPHEESVTLRVAQTREIGWNTYMRNTGRVVQVNYLSSDQSVVYVDQYGRLFGVAPGQATVSCQYVFEDGSVLQGDMQVTVVGAAVAWADASMDSLSLTPGETASLIPIVDIGDPALCSATTSCWENSNPYVVDIDQNTGIVTALNPGVAVVSYWQNLDYPVGENGEAEWGECFVCSTITVTGESAPFSLNAASIALAGEGTFQLEPVYDAEALGTPLSVTWESGDSNSVEVDGSGLVSVHSVFRTFYSTVLCTAEFESGTQTAVCSVTVNRERVQPLDWQYGEGRWLFMDLNSELGFRDAYSLLDDSVHAEVSFESSNPEIVTVSEDGIITSYGVSGDADVVMTIRVLDENDVYTGESYVRSLRVRVNVDTMPEHIEPVYETFIVLRQWNQHYLPLSIEPAYTGCYLVCRSSDESIVSFDEGDGSTEMYFHGGTGLVTIDVTAPDDERLNTQAQVLVVDEDAVCVTTESGESALSAGQSAQLSLICTDGIVIGPELIESFRLMNESDLVTLTEDGLLTVHTEESFAELELWVNVRLVTGHEQSYPLVLQINAD